MCIGIRRVYVDTGRKNVNYDLFEILTLIWYILILASPVEKQLICQVLVELKENLPRVSRVGPGSRPLCVLNERTPRGQCRSSLWARGFREALGRGLPDGVSFNCTTRSS